MDRSSGRSVRVVGATCNGRLAVDKTVAVVAVVDSNRDIVAAGIRNSLDFGMGSAEANNTPVRSRVPSWSAVFLKLLSAFSTRSAPRSSPVAADSSSF